MKKLLIAALLPLAMLAGCGDDFALVTNGDTVVIDGCTDDGDPATNDCP